MDPDISILIPVRNMGETLRRAVASVADGISEIIIVDDGSDDGTEGDIRDLIEDYPEWNIVHMTHKKSRGVGAALNTALRHAKGKFIMRQDADDVSYEKRALVLRENLYPELSGAAIASWFAHLRQGKVNHGMIHAFPPYLTTEDLLAGWRFPHAPAMYWREAVEKLGGWPEDMECSEDHLLHLRLSRLGPLSIVPQVLYFVGNTPNRQTRLKDTAMWDAYAERQFKKEIG